LDTLFRGYRAAVRLGEWDISTGRDCDYGDCVKAPVQDIQIERIIEHPDFQPESLNFHNDISLLRLKTPAVLNAYVQPICLPRTQKLRTFNLDYMILEAAGWSLTKSRTWINIKSKVSLQVLPLAQCTNFYSTLNVWTKQMCVSGNKDAEICDSAGMCQIVFLSKISTETCFQVR
jgi:hypothetical protein